MATGPLLRELYEGESKCAARFRYGLLLFDLLTILSWCRPRSQRQSLFLELIDAGIGLIVLSEFLTRVALSRRPFRDLLHSLGLADVAVIISFLALRALRALRLFRSDRIASRMKRGFPWMRRNYDTIIGGTNLFVFLFLLMAVVYETQRRHNPAIADYVDALYFTVATPTTTGFGDITLPDTAGPLLAILIMIVGVSLFLRLVEVLTRSTRQQHTCLSCVLSEYGSDRGPLQAVRRAPHRRTGLGLIHLPSRVRAELCGKRLPAGEPLLRMNGRNGANAPLRAARGQPRIGGWTTGEGGLPAALAFRPRRGIRRGRLPRLQSAPPNRRLRGRSKRILAMDMTREFRIAAPRQRVWDGLCDPHILKKCIPSCETIDKISDTEFAARVVAEVGRTGPP
jgi:voltage-gated potassium channel